MCKKHGPWLIQGLFVVISIVAVPASASVLDDALSAAHNPSHPRCQVEQEYAVNVPPKPIRERDQSGFGMCYAFPPTYALEVLVNSLPDAERVRYLSVLSVIGSNCDRDLSRAISGSSPLRVLTNLRESSDAPQISINQPAVFEHLQELIELKRPGASGDPCFNSCCRFVEKVLPSSVERNFQDLVQAAAAASSQDSASFPFHLAEQVQAEKTTLPAFNIYSLPRSTPSKTVDLTVAHFHSHALPLLVTVEVKPGAFHALAIAGVRKVCCQGHCQTQWNILNSWGKDEYEGWADALTLASHLMSSTPIGYIRACHAQECKEGIQNLSPDLQYSHESSDHLARKFKSMSVDDQRVHLKTSTGGSLPPAMAIARGDTQLMHAFHDSDPGLLSKKNPEGNTWAYEIAVDGQPHFINWMRKLDPTSMNEPSQSGVSANQMIAWKNALEKGDISALSNLLKAAPGIMGQKLGKAGHPWEVALKHRQHETLKWLAAKATNVLRQPDADGSYVVHRLAADGNLEMLEWIKEVDPTLLSLATKFGETPILAAARAGQVSTTKWLLRENPGALAEKNQKGSNPAHIACSNDQMKAVEYFFSQHPTLFTEENNYGQTPPASAVVYDQHKMLQWFAENAPAEIKKRFRFGNTLAHFAAFNNVDAKTIEELKSAVPGMFEIRNDHGFDANDIIRVRQAIIRGDMPDFKQMVERFPQILDMKDRDGNTLAHLAVRTSQPEIIGWFSEHKPELLFVKNFEEYTPFELVIDSLQSSLLTAIATKNPSLLSRDVRGHSILHELALKNAVEQIQIVQTYAGAVFEELVKKGDANKNTPLHLAARDGNVEAIHFFIEIKPDLLGVAGVLDLTPVQLAVRNGQLEALKVMMQKEPAVIRQVRKQDGRPLAAIAAEENRGNIAEWLLEHDIDQVKALHKVWKDSSIHIAAESGSLGFLRAVADQDPSLLEIEGGGAFSKKIPIKSAARNSQAESVYFILAKRPDLLKQSRVVRGIAEDLRHSDRTNFLKWLQIHHPQSLFEKTNGVSLVRSLVKYADVATLEWLLDADPTLLKQLSQDGEKPHIELIRSANVAGLKFLLNKYPRLLLEEGDVIKFLPERGTGQIMDLLEQYSPGSTAKADSQGNTLAHLHHAPWVLLEYAKRQPKILGVKNHLGKTPVDLYREYCASSPYSAGEWDRFSKSLSDLVFKSPDYLNSEGETDVPLLRKDELRLVRMAEAYRPSWRNLSFDDGKTKIALDAKHIKSVLEKFSQGVQLKPGSKSVPCQPVTRIPGRFCNRLEFEGSGYIVVHETDEANFRTAFGEVAK